MLKTFKNLILIGFASLILVACQQQGGGAGSKCGSTAGAVGTANTGGGAGSGGLQAAGSAGGSGIVVIRFPAASLPGSLAVGPGTNSLGTNSPTGDKIATFTVSGTLTV